jgi:hypothetical protein
MNIPNTVDRDNRHDDQDYPRDDGDLRSRRKIVSLRLRKLWRARSNFSRLCVGDELRHIGSDLRILLAACLV